MGITMFFTEGFRLLAPTQFPFIRDMRKLSNRK